MTEFFHMGGYAFYVWGAYGLAFMILLINLVQPRLCQRRLEKRLIRKIRLAKQHT
uniref:Heme exporter protein D n=1 Tax=Candidatus Kentrum sp. TUN TaxID=2126343 RepID=A0A451ACP3_9GAMM|nr:MAG: heme exporter protein D [Candidatus Kentron sp. TUN]VFK52907.1 MAG: heme exporter protein D [Candidatus Kentron sp. TUN]VFK63774.1 MAG: heme exporter protein D [Candidatus Kentron sp. TUN]